MRKRKDFSIKDVRRKAAIRRLKSEPVFAKALKEMHLFDSFYWEANLRLYEVIPHFKALLAKIRNTLERCRGEKLQTSIKQIVLELIEKKDKKALHASVSYLVSKGYIDTPKLALIEKKLYDWAAAVEEGRGDNTKWESVIDLYAHSNAVYHLRRLKRELPMLAEKQRISDLKELLASINEHLGKLKRE